MVDSPIRRLTTRRIDDRSVGFLVAGASTVAARWMIEAIWRQPPAAGSHDVAGAYVAALFSHNARLAQRFADQHGIVLAGDDLERLLSRREIRCVYVGNHPRHHAETTRAALLAGKHVLCEPPLSIDPDECHELHLMAEHRGLVLALNYAWRATAAMRGLRDQLQADAIGEVLGGRIDNTMFLPLDRQTWRLAAPYGGVLWERSLQDVDLLAFLLLRTPAAVQAGKLQALLGSGVEEDILAAVWLRGGLPIHLHDSYLLPHAPVTVTIFGSTGSLVATQCEAGNAESNLVLRRGQGVQVIPLAQIDPFRASVARFLSATRHGEAPLATALDDRRNVTTVRALQAALAGGGAVSVAPVR
ncbi:MAG TPA: Gfo/Idh/MocA family oxidoreductase [Caldilinea sp.]|nr:Gfo/Idh/MocA family oxidoreductase [Caldilinea sp.]